MVSVVTSALLAQAPGQGGDWRQLIVSSTEADRDRAADLVVQQHRETVSALLQVLSLPVKQNEPYYTSSTPRNTAIRLLGELRAPEAVPALAQWLIPRPGQSLNVMELTDLPPAGMALVKIGMPAGPAVLDILASNGVSSEDARTKVVDGIHVRYVGPKPQRSSPLGDGCLRVLVRIKGLEETEVALRRSIAAETDEARKRNLEDALSALSRPGLRGVFEAQQAQKEAIERIEWRNWWAKEAARKAAEEDLKRRREKQASPEPDPTPPAE
jgi:hypothetical protein